MALLLIFILRQAQSGGSQALSFGRSRAKLLEREPAEGHVRRRRGRRRGERRAGRGRRVPQVPQEISSARRAHPQGRAAAGPAGLRQDAARARHRRRSGRAVLLDLRLGLRRDVRRRRRVARARSVRAGEEVGAVHRVHRRDRRGRPPARRRPGRRSRRARADAEPTARRDGRLRSEHRRHPDRRDQPPRRARSRAAAPRPLRPPDRGRPRRRARPPGDPGRALQEQAAFERSLAGDARAPHARFLRRGSRESARTKRRCSRRAATNP